MVDASRIADPATRTLVRELAELRREVDTLKAGQRASQLGNSSVDNGTLWFTDNGVQRVGIGAQVDGKFGWFAVNGTAPPRPNTPQLTGTVNGVAVTWNGEFAGQAPSDFTHVKVFVSPVGQAFIPSDGNVVGHFLGAATMPVAPLPETDHWCVLIAYNTSGVASEPSFVAGPARPQPVVATEILDGLVTETKLAANAVTQAKLAAGAVGTAQLGNQVVDLSKLANGSVDATKIVDGSITPAKVTFTAADIGSIATFYQASAPTGTIAQGSLWADSDDQNKLYRYSGSGWVAVNDQGVAAALASAQQAQTDAANALSAAAGAEAAVDGKVTVYYQASSPSGANTGDLWLDTDDANKLYRWSGSTWVLVSDTRIAAALVNAQTAQSTADGKIQAFYQAAAPTGVSVGDLWFNTSAGNAVSRWNGSSWVSLPLGSGAIGSGAIGTAHIQNGAVTGTTIAGSAVDTSKLASGAVDASKIAANAVTAPAIQDGAVGSAELSANSVVAGKVAANAITAGTISAGVVGATELAANSVVAGKIAANAVTAGTVAANTIGANEIISNSIVAGKLAADSVTSTNIVAGGVQAANLAAGSVSTEKLVAASVIAEKIAALAVTADKLAANSVTAGAIQAGSVTADKLEALLVLVNTLIAGDPNGWRTEIGDAVTPLLYWDGVNTGFALSRDPATGQSNAYLSGRIEFGNGSQIESDYLDLCEQPATGFQKPTLRQSRSWIDSGPASAITPKWTSATKPGNLLVMSVYVVASSGGSGAPQVTVPSGWTYIDGVTSGTSKLLLYYVSPGAATSRSSESFSATLSPRWAVGLFEYSGIAPGSTLDVSANNSGSGSTANSGTTGTTVQANELQIAAWASPTIGSSGTWKNPTNGFMIVASGNGAAGHGYAVASKVATATGAVSSAVTMSSAQAWLGTVATFRTAVADPIPRTPPTAVLRNFTLRRGGKSTPHIIDDAGQVYPMGRVPYCRIRLNATVSLTASTDVYAQGDWVVTADIYGMAAISTSAATFTNITIPVSGNYLVDYKTIFQASTNATANIVGFVTKNARTSGSSVARDIRQFNANGTDGSPTQANRVVPLVAGDILYFGNWSNASCTFAPSANGILTEMSVHYLGPNF
ncbi:hypothetical protein EV383_4375 [Pseudonocardia sediminis]|uniref:Uncharacterized protein n=1 Tax=Pseudonocardia sediminis TaxID=1397368 RepID=A0A4Q7V271_PSEST|nr:hypothetical protein EV383_4375 [Pseudonocardia sediminis]